MTRRHFDGWRFELRTGVPDLRNVHQVICARAVAIVSLWSWACGHLSAYSCILWRFLAGSLDCLQALTQPAAPDVPRLASGIYAGYLVRWMLLGLGSVLRPNWPDSDPRTRFIARHDAALVIIPFSIFFIVGPFVFSRWRSRPSILGCVYDPIFGGSLEREYSRLHASSKH